MIQLVYKIIYNKNVNYILRNLNKKLSPILPTGFKIPPSGVLKIKIRNGRTLVIHTNQTNYVTMFLFWKGYIKYEYSDIFIKLIKKVDTFYDIGANIGYYSLLAALENDKIKVVAFEPAKDPLLYLKKNVKANHLENIKIEPLALSHHDGEIEFHEIKNAKYKYLKHNLDTQSNAGSRNAYKNFEINRVKSTTFDNYVKLNNELNIDLIKLDTEGTEHLILEKSEYILKTMKPIVICETLFNLIEPELQKIMSSHGYEFYNHTERGLQKVKTIIRKKNDGVRDCFFVHPSKHHLIKEFVVE